MEQIGDIKTGIKTKKKTNKAIAEYGNEVRC